ncbi:MAG: glycine--tRNA ligase [Flavobacteriales bacterium]|nr:glycine--tRNA ligase [Flavobacteriales bacterium]
MSAQDDFLKTIISHSKEYGFIFPSSEIYDGLSATYDYGQYGKELKNNIEEYWWKSMVRMHDNIVGIDSAIFMHPTVWKASGHVDAFNDPLIDNKDSKKRYRADVLIEEHIEKIRNKVHKEVEKAAKRFGDAFNMNQFRSTNPRVVEYDRQIEEIENRMRQALESGDLQALKQLILDLEIADPISGTRNWTDVRQFNLMFATELGSVSGEASVIYLRPETAQGTYINFLNVQRSGRMKIPFGICQIGKAFRNEIIARQFIFRMREFEQMEMQFFVRPGEEMEWYSYWKEARMKWHRNLGMGDGLYRYHDHIKLAHYANAACDIEFDFPMGFKELEGIHSRTDFDLKAHEKYSGRKQQYFDAELNQNYIPYVVETAIGLDRMFMSVLSASYADEKLSDGSERTVMRIPAQLAPVKIAVLPLVKKDGMPEKALEVYHKLKLEVNCQYDDKDAIGRRYRRQDAIGTPYCITIDQETLDKQTVTLRERDSMQQERIGIENLVSTVTEKTSITKLLTKLS